MPPTSPNSIVLTALTGLVLSALMAGAVQARKLLPVDEAGKNPSFLAFRQRLLTAVRQKDHRYVESILSPQIVVSFGGEKGIKDFKKHWLPERSNSQLWPTLQAVLSLGGSFEDGDFVAPYVYSKFPEDLDSLDDQCIIQREVKMHAKPSATSAVVTTLSYDIVKLDEPAIAEVREKRQWMKVTAPNGKVGFVPSSSLRSAMDYRALFSKVKGQWRMTVLVVGD